MRATNLSCLLAALFASATFHNVTAKKISWVIPMNPQEIIVTKGSEVTFEWTGNHDVYKSNSKADFDSCTKTGGTQEGPAANGGSWKQTLITIGTHYYICSVGGHCAAGQKVAVTVVDSHVNWAIPTNSQAITVMQGAHVGFTWIGNHDVYKSASKADFDSCKKTGGTIAAPAANAGTWKAALSTVGTHYYICSVGGHCGAGQKIAITVTDNHNHNNHNHGQQPEPEPEPEPESETGAQSTSSGAGHSSPLSGIINWLWILLLTLAPLVL